MQSEALLSKLETAGILEKTDAEELILSDGFRSVVPNYRSKWNTISKDKLLKDLSDRYADGASVEAIFADNSDDLARICYFAAIHEELPDVPVEEQIRVATLCHSIWEGVSKVEGVPRTFLPVTGKDLPVLINAYQRAIVYVWRQDCDPCDLVKEDFENIFNPPTNELGLLAVYGPDSAEFLRNRYDIAGAPTTLFVRDGKVETRLIGAHYRGVFEAEIEKLREYN